MLTKTGDTICAVSTAPGTGAVAIIRISGPAAFEVTGNLFTRSGQKGKINDSGFSALPSHTVHHGTIGEPGNILDDVLVTLFRAPHSYTGEDVIEISVHGSLYIQQQVIHLLMNKGIRLAQPGEFTLRAFMNGKFDLSQAEAVADLIAAGSSTSHDMAINQLRGGVSKIIAELRKKLVDFTSLIELELDFSEEHVEFASRPDLVSLLNEMEEELTRLIHSFAIGNAIKQGIQVAITGKPNVGKSTLLNTILNEERAIVSEIPGTTRDAIEDTIVLGGYRFRFIDTAGLHDTDDVIETLGIERTRDKIRDASIILYIFDASSESWQDVAEAIEEFSDWVSVDNKKLILIGNKTDMLSELPHGFKDFVEHETIFVSAKRKENIDLIAESLLRTVKSENITDTTLVSSTRHLQALQQAYSSVQAIRKGLADSLSPDLLTIDIRNALYYLGEITGEITTDEILSNIFSRFCIGK